MFHTEEKRPFFRPNFLRSSIWRIYTEPGIKGDTASTNSLKPATVNSATAKDGATIRVPLFINTGDKIRVDTRTVSTTSASNRRKLRLRKKGGRCSPPFFVSLPSSGHSIVRLRPLGYFTA